MDGSIGKVDLSLRFPKIIEEWKSEDDVVFSESSDIKLSQHGSLIDPDKDEAILCDCSCF